MKTNFYIDAFNLYYGCLRKTTFKWLDLHKLCSLSFPNDDVNKIRYFTALIKPKPHDVNKPHRQNAYIRALKTIPCLSLHFGHYLDKKVWLHLVNPPATGPRSVQVEVSEEKGSDGNLASLLLEDAFEGGFEKAVVVSNDSDLAYPIKVVKEKLGLEIHVLFPISGKRRVSNHLSKIAMSSPIISQQNLGLSQFPDTLFDRHGKFHRPLEWA